MPIDWTVSQISPPVRILLIGAVVFLSSPDSDFITGQTLVVDGGGVMP